MLTAEIIFDYVWLHFCSVYPEAKELRVSYGKNSGSKVQILQGDLTFFAKNLPFPETVSWFNWQQTSLPFFFNSTTVSEIFLTEGQTISIQPDIIASAFYLLSGWQEFHATERDKFGRFPYKASVQANYNFITVPVVNYYFDILKTALEKGYSISLKRPGYGNAEFITFLSHDVDRLESAWKVEGIKQLKQLNFGNFAKLGWQKLIKKDHWHNLETVAKTVKKYEAVSTFFWLAQKGKFQNNPNADYEIAAPKYQQLLKELENKGFENAVHGSFGSSENAAQLKKEMAKVGNSVKGNRFHYLCFDPKKTAAILTEANLGYDSSLGFAEHFGFRHSYCFPFRPFDFFNLKPYPILEIPLNLMDATLWHESYLKIPAAEIVWEIKPMLLEIKKFGGCFGLLWHNENFSELNSHNGLAVFENIMRELQNQKSGFQTGKNICEFYTQKL